MPYSYLIGGATNIVKTRSNDLVKLGNKEEIGGVQLLDASP